MSRDPCLYLEDIIETMEKMQGFVAGMTRAEQVATLLSGTEVTEATLESARELMAAGKRET